MPVVLHVAPHPDDELLGAPGALLQLLDGGRRVVDLACSLGRPADARRRLAELREACARAGFELRLPRGEAGISAGDDLAAAEAAIAAEVRRALDDLRPELVVAPCPHDGHHGHEVVGRAVLRALGDGTGRPRRPRLWLWHLWGDAARPTLYVPVPEAVLARAETALRAHAGELARADYVRLLRARAEVASVAGAERVLGWGAPATGARHAELLTELLTDRAEGWPLGAPRVLDPGDPLDPAQPRGVDAGAWLHAPSPRARLGG